MPISPEHKELLIAKSDSKTLLEWVSYFEGLYTKGSIYGFCYHNHLPLRKLNKEEFSQVQSKRARKWHINQDYFKTWSRNMAYIFGFWCADGCIYRGKIFDITQNKKDKYIIKKIAEELEYEGPIMDDVDRQACRINFSCKVIYDDLIKLGGSEQKSMTLKFPDVPKEYLPDFIRGFFDGDGSVMYMKQGRVNSAFTSGSKEFIDTLWQILKDEAGITGGSYDPSSYTLRFGKKDSIKLGEYMYKNNPEMFLLRKREKFHNFMKEEI